MSGRSVGPSDPRYWTSVKDEARRILEGADRRAVLRSEEQRINQPADYKAANAAHSKLKAALTRAVNSGDPDKVVIACRDAVRWWSQPPFNGAWPDDWSRWQRALDDALGFGRNVRLEDL